MRKALLIGSATHGLQGVDNDLTYMQHVLEGYGFEIRRCAGQDATRASILAAYERLISGSRADDAVVVYYSGHGGLARAEVRQLERSHRFIVPVDIDDSTDEDFRGILDQELSVFQVRLTARTRNVTVVLDCCYSARLSRGTLFPKALPRAWTTGVNQHIGRLLRQKYTEQDLPVESNPHAVRLVAAGANQSAFEHQGSDGVRCGVFTEGLYRLLENARGQQVSWDSLARRLREHVLTASPGQRCEVEGPRERTLFSLETLHRLGVLAFFLDEDRRPALRGGHLLGVTVGDVYALLPHTAHLNGQRPLAEATVVEVGTASSRVELDKQEAIIPVGAAAFPVRKIFPRRPVRIVAREDEEARLRALLESSPYVRPTVEPDDQPLATVRMTPEQLEILDPHGDPLIFPAEPSAGNLAIARSNLETLARTARLQTLESGTGELALDARLTLEFGRVMDSEPVPLPLSGSLIRTGDPIYLRIAHHGPGLVFAAIFSLGIDGAVNRLMAEELRPQSDYVFGYRSGLGLVGIRASWPKSVPPTGPRPGALMMIASDRAIDLEAMEQRGLKTFQDVEGRGRARDIAPASDSGRYAIQFIDFHLEPERN